MDIKARSVSVGAPRFCAAAGMSGSGNHQHWNLRRSACDCPTCSFLQAADEVRRLAKLKDVSTVSPSRLLLLHLKTSGCPPKRRPYFPLPLSCGTMQVAVPVTALPARSCAVTVR